MIRYQKGKTNLDFTEARDSELQWHQLGRLQVCTSLLTTMPAPHHSVFFMGQMPFLPPNQERQSTEGRGLPIKLLLNQCMCGQWFDTQKQLEWIYTECFVAKATNVIFNLGTLLWEMQISNISRQGYTVHFLNFTTDSHVSPSQAPSEFAQNTLAKRHSTNKNTQIITNI